MKNIAKNLNYGNLLCFCMALCFFASCGGNRETTDDNLTPEEQQAVKYVKSHIERGDKLMDYKVVSEPMPASLLEQPFKNLRNIVFKAGLDYQSCKTRSLAVGMEKAEQKISEARVQILSLEEELSKQIGNDPSIIVLAQIKSRKSHTGDPQSLVAVFDKSSRQLTEWIPVTTPVQNSVALVINAQDDTLEEYARPQEHDMKALSEKVNNPVLKFVLEAKAL